MTFRNFIWQITSIKQLLGKENRELRSILFYSESSIYYLYFEDIINYILENSEHSICYITSDPNDPVFKLQNDRFKVFYISNLMLAFVTVLLDSEVLIFTMTDLGQFHIKRSTKNVNHIYVFHAVMSTHMVYQKGAFDHYDTIFCVGPHHVNEIKKTEEYYGLKKKQLVKVGYHLIEKIYADHLKFKCSKLLENNKYTRILVAPSWNEGNIIETCIDELLINLLKAGYEVVLRPHPEIFKRNKRKIDLIESKFYSYDKFQLETELNSVANFHRSDILITDWSGIAFEYAFGTERPVVFINTPPKIHNDEYKEIGIEPLEVKLRESIGIVLDLEDIKDIVIEIKKLLIDHTHYCEEIIRLREKYIFNWNYSTQAAGQYILQYIDNECSAKD